MTPRKPNDMSAKSVVDPTMESAADSLSSDSYSENSLAPTRYDLIPLGLAVVAVIICLAVGLSVFFTLKAKEVSNARAQLKVTAAQGAVALQKALNNLISSVQVFHAFFDVQKPYIPVRLNPTSSQHRTI
jgi:uncharacterized protein HemX